MKLWKILLCGLLMALPVFANETEERQTATSLRYVSHELDTRQNKLSAGTNAAITYTNAAGNVEQRTVKSDLTGGTTDTSLPQVNAVNAGLGTKQDDIEPIDNHTAVTYTGQTGIIGQKGIYQTDGTYAEQSDNLIDAKTFNAALKNGLDNEFVCADTPESYSPTGECWLWEVHTNTLPNDYTRLEYIMATGTQYIDTGITMTNDIEFSGRMGTSVTNILGTYIADNDDSGIHGLVVWQSGSKFNFRYIPVDGSAEYTQRTDISYTTNTLYDIGFNINKNSFVVDGQSIAKEKDIKNTGLTIRTGKNDIIASLTIWNNGTKVRNFIPASHIENGSTVVGMYDTVSETFFRNASTGGDDFTPGPVINTNIYIPQNQQ